MKIEFLRNNEAKKEKKTGAVFDILVLSLVMAVLVSVIFLVNHSKIKEPQSSDTVSVFKETPLYDLLGFDNIESNAHVSEKKDDAKKEEMVSEYIKSGGSVDVFGHFTNEKAKE